MKIKCFLIIGILCIATILPRLAFAQDSIETSTVNYLAEIIAYKEIGESELIYDDFAIYPVIESLHEDFTEVSERHSKLSLEQDRADYRFGYHRTGSYQQKAYTITDFTAQYAKYTVAFGHECEFDYDNINNRCLKPGLECTTRMIFGFGSGYGGYSNVQTQQKIDDSDDGETYILANAGVKVVPLYLFTFVSSRFREVNSNLTIRLRHKKLLSTQLVVDDEIEFTHPPYTGFSQINSYYSQYIQVSNDGGNTYHNLPLTEYRHNKTVTITYAQIKAAFGNDEKNFVGKQCKIRIMQRMGSKSFVNKDQNFYYLPSLKLENFVAEPAVCADSAGSVSFKVGNLPEDSSDTLHYFYSLYRYTKNSTSSPPFRTEDAKVTIINDQGENEEYLYAGPDTTSEVSAGYEDLITLDIKSGVYKLIFYITAGGSDYYLPAKEEFLIEEPKPVTAELTALNESVWNGYALATGADSGLISLDIHGGDSLKPYTFYYYNENENILSQSLGNQEYMAPFKPNTKLRLVVKDANGCEPEVQPSIPFDRAPDMYITTGQPIYTTSCHDSNTDTRANKNLPIEMKFNGGAGNYAVQLSDPQNSTFDYPIPAVKKSDTSKYTLNLSTIGEYTLTLNDITGGGTQTTTFRVENPPALNLTNVSLSGIACHNGTDVATLTIDTANKDSYTFYAVPDIGTPIDSNIAVIGNLKPNTSYDFYFAKAITGGQCISDTMTATTALNPPPITALITDSLPISCPGSNNGQITIVPSGGIPFPGNIYDLKLSTEGLFVPGTSYSSSELNDIRYTLQIKDSRCPTPTNFEFRPGVAANQISIQTPILSPDLCPNRITGGPSGSIALSIDPGDRPAGSYSYTLERDGVTYQEITSTADTAVRFSTLPRYANYRVYAEETTTGCQTSTINTPIDYHPNRLRWPTDPVTTTNTVCDGQATGTMDVTATDGFAPGGYTFSISNTEENIERNLENVVSAHFGNLPEGEYSITVQDDSTCTLTLTDSVKANPTPISLTVNNFQHNYCSELNNGQFTITGTTSPGHWVDTLKLSGQYIEANAFTWDNLPEGFYTIEARDDQGCRNDTTLEIINHRNSPKITLSILDSTACSTANNGRIQIFATQNIPLNAFDFKLEGDTRSDPSTIVYDQLREGEYTIHVEDTMGCYSDTIFWLATISEPVNISDTSYIAANCVRAADAGLHLEASGSMMADPGYYFVLNGLDTLTGNSVDFTGYPVGGSNQVVLYDRFGCSDATPQFQFPVRKDSLNLATGQIIDASCPGYANGIVAVEALNGNAFPDGFNYRIIREEDEQVVFEGRSPATTELNGMSAGTYNVEVTDEDNCLALSDPIVVNEPTAPFMQVSPGYVAEKGTSTGWIDATITGGNNRYRVEWYSDTLPNPAQSVLNETAVGTSGLTALPAGSYLVRIQDTAQCVFWDDEWLEMIAVVPEPEDYLALNLLESTPVSCNGFSDGQFILQASGGWGSDYLFGTDPANISNTSTVFSGYPAGLDYAFYVKDTAGVISSAAFTMTEPEVLTAAVSEVTDASCFGLSNGAIALNIQGGNNEYFVSTDEENWTPGMLLSNLPAGDYTIYVRDILACNTTASAEVNQPDGMSIADTSITNTECQVNEGAIIASVEGGTPGYSYSWLQEGEVIDEGAAHIDSLYAGRYTLHVVDNHNCPQDFDFFISDITDLEIAELNTDPVSCWEGSDGGASVLVQRGFPPYEITWPDNTTSTEVSGLPAGEYIVSVFDSEGCALFQPFTIGTPDSLWDNVSLLLDPLCLGVANGEIEIAPTGGTPGYSYAWSNGRSRAHVQNLDAGTWQVTITDDHNCQRIFNYTLGYAETISTEIPADLTLCSNNTYPLDGGNFDFYSWYHNGQLQSSEQVLDISEPGEYLLDVQDIRGCQTTDTIFVNESETELGAQFLMATVVHQYDTVVVFEASVPPPDSISLFLDESIAILESGQYWRNIVVNDTGNFDITLVSYLEDCQDIITKTITVLPPDDENESYQKSAEQLILSANIFPNPNHGKFELSLMLSEETDIAMRLVAYSDGSTLLMKSAKGSSDYTIAFDLEGIMPGVYLLGIEAGNDMITKKIIIH